MSVTISTTSLLTLLYLWLSIQVIRSRREMKISLGTGGDTVLERHVRAHGNFAEYAPLGLLLIGLLEMNDFPVPAVAGIAALLFSGRLLHACALSSPRPRPSLRVIGMGLTFTALAAGALSGLALVARGAL